jgi:hypothetical protein
LALFFAQRGQGKDSSIVKNHKRNVCVYHPDYKKPQSLEAPPTLLSNPVYVFGNTEYARVKIQIPGKKQPDGDNLRALDGEIGRLAAECEKRKIYTVLFEMPKSMPVPGKPITEKLQSIRERAIEHGFYHDSSSFKKALTGIALTNCSAFKDFGFFRVSQRTQRYLRDIYIVDIKQDFNFDKYKHIRSMFKAEAESLAKQLRGKEVVFVIQQKDFNTIAAKEMRRIMDRFGVGAFFYFAGGVSGGLLHEKNPGNYFDSYVPALSAAQRSVGAPKIIAPAHGWTAVKSPIYESDLGYFVVSGFQDEKSLPDDDKFRSDLSAIAASSATKILFDLGNQNFPYKTFNELQTHLHVPCEERGGMLVIKSLDNLTNKAIRLMTHLNVVTSLELARGSFEHYFRIVSPKGGFCNIKRPLSYEPDSRLLCTELSPYALVKNRFSGAPGDLAKEITTVLNHDVKGLIFDLRDLSISREAFKEVCRSTARYFDRDFVVISTNPDTRLDLKPIAKHMSVNILENREEAIIDVNYGISPPDGGWVLFKPKLANPEKPVLLMEISKTTLAEKFMYGVVPQQFYQELRTVVQDKLPIILDLTNYRVPLRADTVKAINQMQRQILDAHGRLAVVHHDLVSMMSGGIKESYPSLTSALTELSDPQRYLPGV